MIMIRGAMKAQAPAVCSSSEEACCGSLVLELHFCSPSPLPQEWVPFLRSITEDQIEKPHLWPRPYLALGSRSSELWAFFLCRVLQSSHCSSGRWLDV